MPEWGMPEVVREARRVDEVSVAADGRTQLASYLRALERVRQPSTRKVARAHGDHLGLGGQTPQGRAVQHPGAVPYKRSAPGAILVLWRLPGPPSRGQGVVAAVVGDGRHLLSLPPDACITAALPASSRATGTRKGEQDT